MYKKSGSEILIRLAKLVLPFITGLGTIVTIGLLLEDSLSIN